MSFRSIHACFRSTRTGSVRLGASFTCPVVFGLVGLVGQTGRCRFSRRRPGRLDPDSLARGQDGPGRRRPDARTARSEALKRKGITSIDLVIVSHHHSDHYGGMDQVIRNFHPSYFVATGSSHTTKTYLKLLQSVRDAGHHGRRAHVQASQDRARARSS